MNLGIEGKWALVCAASKGLGKGCAVALVAEGANVVITARGAEALEATAAELRRSASGEVRTVAGDITTPAGRGKPALTRRDWLVVSGLGFSGYYLASFLDFVGLQYITASLERLILYLNPTLVLAIGVLFLGRRVTPRQLIALAVSYCGVLLVFGHEVSFQGGDTALGAGLVFGSALVYAFYLVLSGEEVGRLGALRLTGLATSIACLCCIVQFLLLRPLSALAVAPEVIWLSVLNATVCTFAPVLMVMMAIERVGASVTAQTGMIGPLSTILMGVVILGEPFSAWILAGTVLVLSGIWLLTKWR